MDPVAAKFIGAGLASLGMGLAAIGVGGAPGGEKDEACAAAGAAAIKTRLPAAN